MSSLAVSPLFYILILLFFPSTVSNGRFLSSKRMNEVLEATYHRLRRENEHNCKHFIVGMKTQEAIDALGWNDTDDSYINYFSLCHDVYAHESMGNHLISYFTQYACSAVSGAHHISLNLHHNNIQNNRLFQRASVFYDSLPKVFVHPRPFSVDDHLAAEKKKCVCVWNCLHLPDSPYLSYLPWIKETFNIALSSYLKSTNLTDATILDPQYDFTTAASNTSLPLFPNVTIHYRCGDNIEAHIGGMPGHGLTPFRKILSLIPKHQEYIYILSDSPSRSKKHPWIVPRCGEILQWLMKMIKEQHPQSVVVVKRGDDHFIDLARMTYADTFIASASTFSFFPAIENTGKNVHFPPSSLFPPVNISLGDHFHWIKNLHLIYSGWPIPWYLIYFALTEQMIRIQDCEGQVVQGRNRWVYLIQNGERHAFNTGSFFEECGFSFGEVWHIGEDFVESIPRGIDAEQLNPKPKPTSRGF